MGRKRWLKVEGYVPYALASDDDAKINDSSIFRDKFLIRHSKPAVQNPPSPSGSVFRTPRACAVAMARRSPGDCQVLRGVAGLPPT